MDRKKEAVNKRRIAASTRSQNGATIAKNFPRLPKSLNLFSDSTKLSRKNHLLCHGVFLKPAATLQRALQELLPMATARPRENDACNGTHWNKMKNRLAEFEKKVGQTDSSVAPLSRDSIGTMILMEEFRVRGDIDAKKFAIRMKVAYMSPHVGSLTKVMLAVRALESLRRPALVLEMPYHVTAMFVAARAARTRMTTAIERLLAPPLRAPIVRWQIWKRKKFSDG